MKLGLIQLYINLIKTYLKWAMHTVLKNILIGGVYGVVLGSAFFGESMFSKEKNGSKIALKHLVEHLNNRGFTLFDTQFQNPHLKTLGCMEIYQKDYIELLKCALIHKVSF